MAKPGVMLTKKSAEQQRQLNAERRLRHRDDARAMLRTEEYIETTHQAIYALLKGYEKQTDAATGVEIEVPLDKTRVQSIKASADLSLRLLSKTLPDLKSVELEDNRAADPKNLSTGELMQILEKMSPGSIEEAQFVEVEAPEAVQEVVQTPNW